MKPIPAAAALILFGALSTTPVLAGGPMGTTIENLNVILPETCSGETRKSRDADGHTFDYTEFNCAPKITEDANKWVLLNGPGSGTIELVGTDFTIRTVHVYKGDEITVKFRLEGPPWDSPDRTFYRLNSAKSEAERIAKEMRELGLDP